MKDLPQESTTRRSKTFPPVVYTKEGTRLPDDFEPTEYDVLCGRTKQSLNHKGNQRFRDTIFANLDRYNAAITKLDKSIVVTSIVDSLRSKAAGGFVRFEKNEWWEIGDQLAREKVGHALRDAIKTRNKRAKKKQDEKRTAMEVKREALLKMQRRLFEESLTQAGECMDVSLDVTANPGSMSMELAEISKAAVKNESSKRKDKKRPSLTTCAFYDVDDVENEVLEPPSIARQITFEDVTKKHLGRGASHLAGKAYQAMVEESLRYSTSKRKAMGDGEYYDIAPTTSIHRQVTLENVPAPTQQLEEEEEILHPKHLLPLEMMPEPTPVVGPGIKFGGVKHTPSDNNNEQATPPTCNRRQVSLDKVPPFPAKTPVATAVDELPKPSTNFTFYDVEGDALENYVVQRISNSAA